MELDRLQAFWRALVEGQELDPEDPDTRWTSALSALRDLMHAAYVTVGVAAPGQVTRTTLVGHVLHRRHSERLVGVAARPASDVLIENRLSSRTAFRTRADGYPGIRVAGFAFAPVPRRRSENRSWLVVGRRDRDPVMRASHRALLTQAARGIGILLDNEALVSEYEHLAMTDALTLIPNYRFLRLTLARELARANRHGEIFTVVMVDVDNLKKYNAQHGHLAGSELLQQLAQLLQSEIRATDVVAKYGGDEFLLILPRTDSEGGLILSERIRRRIAHSLRGRGGERLSCSFGVAGFPQDGRNFESLISAADHALFTAKEEGRNLVVASLPSTTPSGLSGRTVEVISPRGRSLRRTGTSAERKGKAGPQTTGKKKRRSRAA
ncbi:MAG: GGDEF domain-containing protein [Candidatus Eisenbacteria bacterium]|uniref:GGDEF domain-containing protein n=1 Tax=Eiseniibacteriota bacterium TaxID=2212470 RepID=A0A956RNP7_UNCEI|nr:GGDEF domain-containing protein [Candidatus Eisenbacteria bacterium]